MRAHLSPAVRGERLAVIPACRRPEGAGRLRPTLLDVSEPQGEPSHPPLRVERRCARLERVAAGLLVLGLVLCVGAYVAAVHARGASFSWRRAMISDLGRTICRDWHGFWVCSPRADLFNVAVGVAGACILAAGVLTRDRLGRFVTAALVCLGVGLVWVAVFPADGAIGVHMVGGVLALPAPSVLLLAHGLVGVRSAGSRGDHERFASGREPRHTLSRVLGALGAVSSLMSLDHVMPAPAPIPRGVAEGISLLALAVALVVVAFDLLRRPRDSTAP